MLHGTGATPSVSTTTSMWVFRHPMDVLVWRQRHLGFKLISVIVEAHFVRRSGHRQPSLKELLLLLLWSPVAVLSGFFHHEWSRTGTGMMRARRSVSMKLWVLLAVVDWAWQVLLLLVSTAACWREVLFKQLLLVRLLLRWRWLRTRIHQKPLFWDPLLMNERALLSMKGRTSSLALCLRSRGDVVEVLFRGPARALLVLQGVTVLLWKVRVLLLVAALVS